MTHFEDDMLPPLHKFSEAAELVKLGRDQCAKDVWDAVQELVKVCNHGPVVKLNDLYRILFKESEG